MAAEEEAPPPPPCKCEKGAPKWVVTFGDMMSLLLCFFILLLSFSTTDVIKYKQMAGSVADAFGISESSTPDKTSVPTGDRFLATHVVLPTNMAALVAARASAKRVSKSSSDIDMESGADWVRIRVDGDALFDSGDYRVRPEAAALLDQIGEIINNFDGTVSIEGHTDGDPPSTSRFDRTSYLANYELASLRSIAVLDYLVINDRVEKEKLIPVSFGEVKPRENNDSPEGKARNRRVEFEFRTGAQKDYANIQGEFLKPD